MMASSSGSQFNFTLPIEALSGQNANVLSALLGMQQPMQGEELQSIGKVIMNDNCSFNIFSTHVKSTAISIELGEVGGTLYGLEQLVKFPYKPSESLLNLMLKGNPDYRIDNLK